MAAALALTVVMLAVSGCAQSDGASGGSAPAEALSLAPASDEVYRCLTEKGWEVTISWDGGVGITSEDVPPEQEDRYDRDSAACWAIIDERIAALPPKEIENVYVQELETRQCLIDEGYSVDSPPSKQQFVDTFHTDPWMAYAESTALSAMSDEDAWRAINEECRQPSWSLGR